ncbi:hypothetical protein EYF80_025851 [Liparis tanakae]|uniref:Uncharacterized protein n=1 Tax=Liparis tanakae TaxID=230148 RepID=A0A4Z2HDG4_9TELE|nr:hypothetical protein EYF80_025851 [Liparis tanakae]
MTSTSRGPSSRSTRSTRMPVGSHTWFIPQVGSWLSGGALTGAAVKNNSLTSPKAMNTLETKEKVSLRTLDENRFNDFTFVFFV